MLLKELQKKINDLIEDCPRIGEARIMVEERDGVLTDIFDVVESADWYKNDGRIELMFFIYTEHMDMSKDRIDEIEKSIETNKLTYQEIKNYINIKEVPDKNMDRLDDGLSLFVR